MIFLSDAVKFVPTARTPVLPPEAGLGVPDTSKPGTPANKQTTQKQTEQNKNKIIKLTI